LVTNPIPWDLSESTDTPVMDQIFEQWVGKDEVKSLYQILAYCCLTDYPIHRIFCFIGSGLNGKSKYLELLSKFVGLENGTTTELDVLLTSKFEMCRLYRKLYCLMGETNFAEMNKTSVIKRLTGQDMIPYEFKNKNPFEDYNYAKILIATNNLPTTTDKTDGFYRRWKIIDFPNRFSEKSDILATIPLQEYNNLATKCKNILIELLKNREFNNEGSIEDRKRNFEEKSNPLDKFWKENIILNPYGHIFKTEFKRTLDEWCREKRFRIFSDISISNFMKEKEIEFEKRKAEWVVDDGRTNYFRAWVGISWRTTNAKSQE
jgi:putative DNA primase/helicase